MINELEGVDWSSMSHAYGPADDVPVWLREMGSPDPEVREKAFGNFYGAAHHQGDVYPCTAASLPFLFALADGPATPDRASVVALLLSIGREASHHDVDAVYFTPDGTESRAHTDVVAQVRERADAFVRWAADADLLVRRAAIEALGLFLDDADLALEVLRGRLAAEDGTPERLLVLHTTADLALRLPAVHASATAWLDALIGKPASDPEIRLAALVHRARCTPQRIGGDLIPQAIELLRQSTPTSPHTPDDEADEPNTGEEKGTSVSLPSEPRSVPPEIAAAFEDLERHNRVHAPTTSLLRTLHTVLDARIPERTALLTEQLRSSDDAVRYDAIRMAQDLMATWRGDHTNLVLLLTDCLLPDDPYTAAAAAEALKVLAPVSEPAREALAFYVDRQRTVHGGDVWAAPQSPLRRAHQEAVLALARLHDLRALPCLLTALDDDVDAWRALQVIGQLRPAAHELVPRLTRRLAGADFSKDGFGSSTGALLTTLAALRDPAAVPALTNAVTAATRQENWRTAATALDALSAFGTGAATALHVVHPLADAQDIHLRMAATGALWQLEGSVESVVPKLQDLLDTHEHSTAADVLGRIGPPAAMALPRLRSMLTDGYEWTRIHAASALWDIGGEAGAPAVVETLLGAWEKNDATSNYVVACLHRMGSAAATALPKILAELALSRRSGHFGSAADDEELQTTCRAIVTHLV
ncbi:HEAT repeat domain-containing protein [Streptomyces sp. NPDC057694]|uniref:HEAT repeat domain-containing protein n=1 Tax=Streptomyces sp. NPDC057694 TaxID=3346216 RepID=UPI0036BB58FD